jgi:hypothetical protein
MGHVVSLADTVAHPSVVAIRRRGRLVGSRPSGSRTARWNQGASWKSGSGRRPHRGWAQPSAGALSAHDLANAGHVAGTAWCTAPFIRDEVIALDRWGHAWLIHRTCRKRPQTRASRFRTSRWSSTTIRSIRDALGGDGHLSFSVPRFHHDRKPARRTDPATGRLLRAPAVHRAATLAVVRMGEHTCSMRPSCSAGCPVERAAPGFDRPSKEDGCRRLRFRVGSLLNFWASWCTRRTEMPAWTAAPGVADWRSSCRCQ